MLCNLAEEIEQRVTSGLPFAVYRMPYEQDVHFVDGCRTISVSDIVELDDMSEGFVMAPFDIEDSRLPIVVIPFDKEGNSEVEQHMTCPSYDMQYEEYCQVLQQYKKHLTEGSVDKLVLARSVSERRHNNMSIGKIYAEAVALYPRMMIYLCYTPATGMWMGCSPEILVEGGRGSWQTVALAGTQPYADNVVWDDKNRNEQHYVEMYIENAISQIGRVIDKHGPYTSRAGHLAHLRTDYYFSTVAGVGIGTIASSFHPTPAVCGLPQAEAKEIIRSSEPTERLYYSGFVGVIGEKSRLFVNLRCARITAESVICYAGGGIMPTSEPANEWWETEAKMATLRNIFNNER